VRSGATSSESCVKVLNLTKKKPKKLQPTQAYSWLYYKKKLKPVIAGWWAAYITENPEADPKKGLTVKFCNDIIKEMWLQELPDVRSEVEKFQDEGFFEEELEEDEDGGEAGDNLVIGAEEQQWQAKAFTFQQ
jgi:hypothetical protein